MMSNSIRFVASKLLNRATLSAFSLLFFGLFSQYASAQATYKYTGNPFTLFSCGPNAGNNGTIDCSTPGPDANTSYTVSDFVSATLSFDSALAPNLDYQDVTSLSGFLLTMNDGQQTLSTSSHPAGVIAKVSTDGSGNIIGPWLLVINVGNAADSGIASENEPPVQPFVQDQGTLSCCPPTIQGNLALNQFNAGTWNSGTATPAEMVANLITTVQGMKIPKQGTSLTNQLQVIAADITAQNGLACLDLLGFANHVKAQTGNSITSVQSKQILSAVTAIQAVPRCGS
jgi:hypothetical protein